MPIYFKWLSNRHDFLLAHHHFEIYNLEIFDYPFYMTNPSVPYLNYQYLMYSNPAQLNTGYPSLTQAEEGHTQSDINDKEELANIVQYIKNLKDPEKR